MVSQCTLSPSGKNINTITLVNLPGEMLTDIRALADHFLIALPNINTGLPWEWAKGLITSGERVNHDSQ